MEGGESYRSQNREDLIRLHFHVQLLHSRATFKHLGGIREDDAVVRRAGHTILISVVGASAGHSSITGLLDHHDRSH